MKLVLRNLRKSKYLSAEFLCTTTIMYNANIILLLLIVIENWCLQLVVVTYFMFFRIVIFRSVIPVVYLRAK